mgnify:CR=1 FL=1
MREVIPLRERRLDIAFLVSLEDGADLAKARSDVETAQERAAATERRALLEIDQERQARSRADKTADALREKLADAEGRERRQALEHAEAITRTQMELGAKASALNRALEAQEELQRETSALHQQLQEARGSAASSAAPPR